MTLRKQTITLLTVFFTCFQLTAQTPPDVCLFTKILSADSMEGRYPGSKGSEMSASFIRRQFAAAGLTLMFDSSYQYFQVIIGVKAGAGNSLSVNEKNLVSGADYIPLSYSASGTFSGPPVFAGYGYSFSNDSLKWDDYANIDVKGKWVMILRGNPGAGNQKQWFQPYSSDRGKVLTAKDRGAVGVILINSQNSGNDTGLIPLTYEKSSGDAGIAVLHINMQTAYIIMKPSGFSLAETDHRICEDYLPVSFDIPGNINARVEIEHIVNNGRNIAALLPGNKDASKFIVIGAHYDHLGYGGTGSGSRMPDTSAIHNGADDNASGTAMVMWLAQKFAPFKGKYSYNLVFVTFDAEEMGLLGSAYFVKHLPFSRKDLALMINFDMLGRFNGETRRLGAGGTGTMPDAELLLKKVCDTSLIKLSFSKEGYGPSDHASFYADSIPVMYFNTGVHSDYHTPFDDYSKINCEGMNTIGGFLFKAIKEIAEGNYNLTYIEYGDKPKGNGKSGLKVTLGIMPDMISQDVTGVGVAGVNPGGPAFRAGMLKGDIIKAINGKAISNIYEYMERLKTLQPGQNITVDIIRNGSSEVLLISL